MGTTVYALRRIAEYWRQLVKGCASPAFAKQLASVFEHFSTSVLMAVVFSLVFAAAIYSYTSHLVLGLWIASLWSVMGLRWLMATYFLRVKPAPEKLVSWVWAYTAGCIVAGSVWGSAAFLFIASDNQTIAILASFFLVAVAVSGLMTYSSLPLAAISFYLATLLPLIVCLTRLSEPLYLVMAGAVVFVGCIVLYSYVRTYRITSKLLEVSGVNAELKQLVRDNKVLLRAQDKVVAKLVELESESSLFRAIVEGAEGLPIIIHDVDNGGRIVYGNDAACRHLGVDLVTLKSMMPQDYVSMRDESVIRQRLDLLRQGKTVVFEDEHCAVDGRRIPVEVVLNPLQLDDSLLAVSYCRDVSERRALEHQHIAYEAALAREEAEAQFRILVEAFPDHIARLDLEGRFRYASKAVAQRFGKTQEEMVGYTPIELSDSLGDDHHDDVYLAALQVVRERSPVVFEKWITRGKRRACIEFRHVPELTPTGEMIGVIGFVRDITERAKLDEAQKFLASQDWSVGAEPFLNRLVRFLAQAFLVDTVMVQLLVGRAGETSIYIKAVHSVDNLPVVEEYPLKGSLCEAAMSQSKCLQIHNACVELPKDRLLQTCGVADAICLPLFGANNTAMGFITVLDRDAINDIKSVVAVLQLVAGRVVAQIERERFELAEAAREQDFRMLVENSPDFISRFDTSGHCIYINPALATLNKNFHALGARLEDFDQLSPDSELFREKMTTVLETGEDAQLVCRFMDSDGEIRHVDMRITAEHDSSGKVRSVLAISRDITGRLQLEESLRYQASIDTLTNLPNRRVFTQRLQQEVARARRADQKVAVLFVDLDRFKEVNDTLGHDVGDLLLQEAAGRLTRSLRESDTVARFGGDEFVVLLPDLDDLVGLGGIAEGLIKVLADPYYIDGRVVYVSASIGIASYPVDTDTANGLISYADQAMYAAKQYGRNGFQFFTAGMQAEADDRVRLVSDLRLALQREQLSVVYQPIVDSHNEKVVKAEALLRWTHPQRGMISPDRFIPLAEDTGLINEIGNWVFRQAVAMAKEWQDLDTDERVQVSINISPRQFAQADIVESWLGWINETALPPGCITIEVTESLLLENQGDLYKQLSMLRDAGIQLAIDDFGTGYSAMAYLKKFHIDYLKIDGSFVRDLEVDDSDCAIAETIAVMASKLGMKSIAECVETAAQRDILLGFGCDFLQGYYYAKPMPRTAFLKYVAADSGVTAG